MKHSKFVSDLMTHNVITVTPEDKLSDVCHLMSTHRISCIVIVCSSNHNRPVGIITERRVVSFINEYPNIDFSEVLVESFITPKLYTIAADQSLVSALAKCQESHVRHLIVLDKHENLAGVISYTNIVDDLFCDLSKHIALGLEDELDSNNRSMLEVMQELALKDPLTKIGNRRSMDIDLSQIVELANRYNREFSLILLDVDYFKKYNDSYGHVAGDTALVSLCEIIEQNIRITDSLYRYGGEEFLLLLPETTEENAHLLAERLIHKIAEKAIPHESSPFKVLTASSGVISNKSLSQNKTAESEKQLIEKADIALYTSKANGRNRTTLYHANLEKKIA